MVLPFSVSGDHLLKSQEKNSSRQIATRTRLKALRQQ
jgi:hypothetical protein